MVRGMKSHPNRCGGFTLMELIVVIAIITILTTIVGINVIGRAGQAKVTATKTNLNALKSAFQIYKTDNGVYPSQAQGLKALVEKTTVEPVPQSVPPEGYLTSRNVPKDGWNRDFIYLVPGRKGEPYEIISYGSEGEPGGKDDAADISTSDL